MTLHAAEAVASSGPMATDWLTAIGTIAAVLVALGFGAVEYRRGRVDRQVAVSQQRRAQAVAVNAWLSVELLIVDGFEPDFRGLVYLVNGSQAPVYQVTVTIPAGVWGPHEVQHEYGLLTPTDSPLGVGEPDFIKVDSDQDVQLAMTFRDASGAWWRRETTGLLAGPTHAPSGATA